MPLLSLAYPLEREPERDPEVEWWKPLTGADPVGDCGR